MEDQGLQESVGQPASTTPETSHDDWAEAEVAYNEEPKSSSEEVSQEQGAQGSDTTIEEQPGSQQPTETASTEGVNLWNVDNITNPEQFKQHIKTVQAHVTKQNQAKSAELKQWQDGYSSIMQVVGEVAQDPSRLVPILRENAANLAQAGVQINPQIFSQNQQPQPSQPQPTYDPVVEQQNFKQNVVRALREADSAESLADRIGDLFIYQENKYQQRLDEVRNGVVSEINQGFQPIIDKTQREGTINHINNELSKMATEIPDLEKYDNAIIEHINNKPHFRRLLDVAIKNPQLAAQNGITIQGIVGDAYKIVSEKDRTEAAIQSAIQQRKNKIAGSTEKPGPYKPTIKSDGEDWDDIEREMGNLFVRA